MASDDDGLDELRFLNDQRHENGMRARLGVTGDFIRVVQLAKALGISSTSIHSQIRRRVFPIPHRRVGNVVLVKLSDYLHWLENASQGVATPVKPMLAEAAGTAVPDSIESADPIEPSIDKKRETKAEFKARINREVLAEMRAKGFDV